MASRALASRRDPTAAAATAGRLLARHRLGNGHGHRRRCPLGLRTTGIELVPEFVAYSRSHDPRTEDHVGASESLPFADEQFDYVTLISVLEHVEDWRRTLGEAARVLKPGGGSR